MTNASPLPKARAREEEEGMVGIYERASLVGQQNICKNQTRGKRSELMSVKMQSCAMLDDYDKEIKIAGESEWAWFKLQEHKTWYNTLDLSIIPEVARLHNAPSLNPAFTAALSALSSIKETLTLVVTSIITLFLSSLTSSLPRPRTTLCSKMAAPPSIEHSN